MTDDDASDYKVLASIRVDFQNAAGSIIITVRGSSWGAISQTDRAWLFSLLDDARTLIQHAPSEKGPL